MGPIDVAEEPGLLIVRIGGELDAESSNKLRELLFGTVDSSEDGVGIVLDLSDVTFIDSTGLGVLVAAQRRARSRDTEILVRSPSKQVATLFDTTGVTKILPLED